MKNVAKFEETRKAVELFKERTEYLFEEADEKLLTKGSESKVYQKAFLKALQTTELTISIRTRLVSFEKVGLGSCIQPIYTKKRRINVIPICAMVQLYKESIKDVPEVKTSEIPFTLTGFWNMDKANNCVIDLMKVKTKQARAILSIINQMDSEERRNDLRQILTVVEGIRSSNTEGGYIVLTYEEDKFKINLSNTKLNVVPLCKIFCKYYSNVLSSLEEFCGKLRNERIKFRMEAIQKEFRTFMEKYFIPEMLRR